MSYIYVHAVTTLILHHFFFFFNAPATTEIYTLSLHDALPISSRRTFLGPSELTIREWIGSINTSAFGRSEEHTSELQSRGHLVCRLLLEKKNLIRRGSWSNKIIS